MVPRKIAKDHGPVVLVVQRAIVVNGSENARKRTGSHDMISHAVLSERAKKVTMNSHSRAKKHISNITHTSMLIEP